MAEATNTTDTEKKVDLSFMGRVRANKTTRWVRFSIVILLYLLWTAWMGEWWLLLGVVLLFDIYITGYIPFTWWKTQRAAL